jgi:hypothetical protein
MKRRFLPGCGSLVALSILACATAAEGQITALHIVSRPAPADVLPGYVVNDLLIDFNGQYTGSQMIVELTSGSIFQAPPPAGNSPPIADLIGLPDFATIEWDTFLANGGPTAEDTVGSFGLGGAAIHVDLDFMGQGTQRSATFSNSVIDQSWNPAGDNEIFDRTGFMVARVTFSDDANGLLGYYASAGGVAGVGQRARVAMLPIRNGVVIPEPSAVVLLGLGVMNLVVLTSRRGMSRLVSSKSAGGR